MDILIKRKNYDVLYEFLNESTSDSDWQIFIDNIKINPEFLSHFKNYIINLKCVFTLKLFFAKLFSLYNKDKVYQEIVYEIIIHFMDSNNEFSSHILIKNLFLVQILKLCILDGGNREKLNELIINTKIEDQWFIELLKNFNFYKELGVLYELNKDFDKSIFYYKKSGCIEKVDELNEKINGGVDEEYNLQNDGKNSTIKEEFEQEM